VNFTRTLRAGLRRVHPDRADGQRRRRRAQGGARHGGEQEPGAGGVRHGGAGQGRRGEQVPRRRLLRRRPRPRRPGLRPAGTYPRKLISSGETVRARTSIKAGAARALHWVPASESDVALLVQVQQRTRNCQLKVAVGGTPAG
jgi:hypothetical protein